MDGSSIFKTNTTVHRTLKIHDTATIMSSHITVIGALSFVQGRTTTQANTWNICQHSYFIVHRTVDFTRGALSCTGDVTSSLIITKTGTMSTQDTTSIAVALSMDGNMQIMQNGLFSLSANAFVTGNIALQDQKSYLETSGTSSYT
jgi:hypothetical protein